MRRRSSAVGRGLEIERKLAISLPHSIGLFYSAFTAFLGFEVNEGEYKVMGMAAFGQPSITMKCASSSRCATMVAFEIEQRCFEFLAPETLPYTRNSCVDLVSPGNRKAEFAVQRSDLPDDLTDAEAASIMSSSTHYADLAASVQLCTEELILHIVAKASEIAGTRRCLPRGRRSAELAGQRPPHPRTRLQSLRPSRAGDAGNAIGAAASYYHRTAKQPRMQAFASPYLGSPLDATEVEAAIAKSGFDAVTTCSSDEELAEHVAGLLAVVPSLAGCRAGRMGAACAWCPQHSG